MNHRIAIALGGDMGDTEALFRDALSRLAAFVQGIRQAPVIVTKPVGCVPGTPDFRNSAVIGETACSPMELLERCQAIERVLGRPASHSSHEQRPIDLDLLLYDDLQLVSTRLVIPHPRMRERRFVLEPLAAIAGDWAVPPTGETVQELLDKLP